MSLGTAPHLASPSECPDQLIHFVDEPLSLRLIVRALRLFPPQMGANGAETGTLVSASSLHVAKMENSLNENDVLDIDVDPDRFYFFISGLQATSVSIKLATVDNPKSAYDDETEIELEGGNGTWMTKSLLLVSDDEDDLLGDDEDATNYGLDDEPNDRTHKVALGGKVKIAAVKINGHEITTNMKTAVPAYYKINAQVYRMSDATESTSGVELQIDVANERLAQFAQAVRIQFPVRLVMWWRLSANPFPRSRTVHAVRLFC